ncbi:MAG: polysaccharide deacetylase family protein [Ktedonobacteraceae bacterium]
MDIDIIRNGTHPNTQKKVRRRTPLVVACGLGLWLLGSLTLVLAIGWTTTKQDVTILPPLGKFDPQTKLHSHVHSTKSVRGIATPTMTPQPTPHPITPLPLYVQQQVAVLEAHDRFFYHGNTSLPEIALTFDDGPNPPYTAQILSILQHYGVKATFFCMGKHVQQYPKLVKQEYRQGNLVENHSWSHPYMPSLSEPSLTWQLSTTSNIIEHVTGERPTLFRPPYGAFSSPVLKVANTFGLSTFIWNADPEDWSMPSTNTIISRVLNRIGYGSIVLLHDGGGDRSQTVAALPTIIEWLQGHGYTFVTLKQLVHDTHKNSTALSAAPLANQSPLAQSYLWRRETAVVYYF